MAESARSSRTRVALAVVAVLVVAAAVALGIAAESKPRPGEINYAHVDQPRTTAVADQAQRITDKVFSFTPDTVAATKRTAQQTLRGDAVAQYEKLYGPLLSQARNDGLSMDTSVASVGVQQLRDDHATVLVFANQRGQKKGSDQPSLGGARVKLELLHTDDGWKIIGITVL
ncbi:hypothetical protein [Haloechinothrix halophila]|uniref:hypothetical protein n=1 Tax=Haloechinothrix halophila TaxID=1069073 RepID=UPI0003FE756B|nr:hypothetical protein [Haloechinothrix halophila]